jgi:hypothetical protein
MGLRLCGTCFLPREEIRELALSDSPCIEWETMLHESQRGFFFFCGGREDLDQFAVLF